MFPIQLSDHTTLSEPVIQPDRAIPIIKRTVRAEECLRHADLVCIGEGEGMMVEIATRLDEGRPYHDIQNLAYRNAQGELVFNPMLPLVKDLDALPLPDYDYEDHYVLHEGAMARFTPALNGAFSNGQARLTIHATTWAARSYPALPASSSALAAR